jgi:hypothetical protein
MSDTILKGEYPSTIPANVWFNMVQWFQKIFSNDFFGQNQPNL